MQATPEREVAEEIIAGIYRHIGRERPRFLWFDNPVACVLACRLREKLAFDERWRDEWQPSFESLPFRPPGGGRISRLVWHTLDEMLRHTAIQTAFRYKTLGSRVADRYWLDFWLQIEGLVGADHAARLRAELHVRHNLHAARPLTEFWTAPVYGFWGGMVEPSAEPRSVPSASEARLAALQRACGWWFPCAAVVICAARAPHIRLDEEDRLHAERGPALELSSEHRSYVWHGTHVPPEWIEQRSELDPLLALTHANGHLRRAAAEIIGWPRVLALFVPRVVDVDRDPQIGTLLEYELPRLGVARFLRVRCGTGREFVLSVPREMRSALEANAWTYGLDSNEYKLEVRT